MLDGFFRARIVMCSAGNARSQDRVKLREPHCLSNVRGKIAASGCKAQMDDCLERDKDGSGLETGPPRNIRLAVNRRMGRR